MRFDVLWICDYYWQDSSLYIPCPIEFLVFENSNSNILNGFSPVCMLSCCSKSFFVKNLPHIDLISMVSCLYVLYNCSDFLLLETCIWFLTCTSYFMPVQTSFFGKTLSQITFEWFLACMNPLMRVQLVFSWKNFLTHITLVYADSNVLFGEKLPHTDRFLGCWIKQPFVKNIPHTDYIGYFACMSSCMHLRKTMAHLIDGWLLVWILWCLYQMLFLWKKTCLNVFSAVCCILLIRMCFANLTSYMYLFYNMNDHLTVKSSLLSTVLYHAQVMFVWKKTTLT